MPASAAEILVREAFTEQAGWCRSLASPLTAQVCDLLASREWPDGEVAERLRTWPGDPRASADAVPLRLCGGLHAAVRSGEAPELAATYPPNLLLSPDEMWPAVHKTMTLPGLSAWLDGPPQTNEVGRSNALVSGLLTFADRFGKPIELLELGASAGLNLNLDRFSFDLGGHHIGNASSPLKLTPEWRGPPPPLANLKVVDRAGVDQSPVDAIAEGDRLLAYVWADQQQRIAQLEAALEVARAHPIQVEQADAAPWIEERLARPQPEGTGRAIMHSIAFQYFPPSTQARVTAAIEAAGRMASEDRPLGWLRFERLADEKDPSIRLQIWPGGGDFLLGHSHPHGASISWSGDPVH